MTPRERVMAALERRMPDRVPRFEIWIDAMLDDLGGGDPVRAYVDQNQDAIMMPTKRPAGSNAWQTGIDEWGCLWQAGTYVNGVVDTLAALVRYSPSLDTVGEYFDPDRIRRVRRTYPDHCLMFGTHIGPFTAAYMAMGMERFFLSLGDNPELVNELLEHRTRWCIRMYQEAIRLGADVVVLGDDAGSGQAPMISPAMWRRLVHPFHCRIVAALDAPVIWHSDGNVEDLLPMAIEAGFVGFHGLDAAANMDLDHLKHKFGRHLVMIGNVDIRVLYAADLAAVRAEIDRCLTQGAPGGGYMLATCSSITQDMNPAAVAELFRYADQVGHY